MFFGVIIFVYFPTQVVGGFTLSVFLDKKPNYSVAPSSFIDKPECCRVFVLGHHVCFPTRLAGGFALSVLLDRKAVVAGSCRSFSPPRCMPSLLPRMGFCVPTARQF